MGIINSMIQSIMFAFFHYKAYSESEPPKEKFARIMFNLTKSPYFGAMYDNAVFERIGRDLN